MTGTESSNPDPNSRAPRTPERYYIRIVLLLTALTYLGSIRFEFVSEDYPQIIFNPFIKAWHYVPQYFIGSVWRQLYRSEPGSYFRPLFLFWTRLNYSIFADRSLGWHTTAVFLHLLVTWLVYLLVKKMTGRFTLAWLTALFFGVHPVHHEVVAWISGTTESLSAVLVLGAFLAYLRSLEKSKTIWMTLSCVLYALALLCNESSIVLPVLVFAHGWIGRSPGERAEPDEFDGKIYGSLTSALFYLPIMAVYFYMRYRVSTGYFQPFANTSLSMWLLTLPSVLFFYARNWFSPTHLSANYDLYYQMRLDWAHVVFPALIVFAMGCVIWVSRKQFGFREVGSAAAWMIIPLLPALAFVVFKPDELVHDRFFYLPSIGAALLVALCVERYLKSRQTVFGQPLGVVVGALVLTLVLAAVTIRTARFWKDNHTLYTRAHKIAPENPAAASGLSEELIDQKEFDQAEALLESAQLKGGGDARFALNLGRVEYHKKQYPKAEENIRRSIALGPYAGEPYVYLGMIQLKQDHPREALVSLQRAVELSPMEAHFRTSYGIVLEMNGNCPAAMSQFEAALALTPGDGLTLREMFRCRAASASSGLGSSSAKP